MLRVLYFVLLVSFISLLVYLFSSKFSITNDMPKGSVYQIDQDGMSIVKETLELNQKIESMVIVNKIIKIETLPSDSLLIYQWVTEEKASDVLSSKEVQNYLAKGGSVLFAFQPQKDLSTYDKNFSVSEPLLIMEPVASNITKSDIQDFQEGLNDLKLCRRSVQTYFKNFKLKTKGVQSWGKIPSVGFDVEAVDVGGQLQLMSSRLGKGKVYFLSDGQFLLNEYFLRTRDVGFLNYLFGGNKQFKVVCFEERFLGNYIEAGILELLFHYRLGSTLVFFLFLVILLIWRFVLSSYFIEYEDLNNDESAKSDHVDLLASLLSKNIKKEMALQLAVKKLKAIFGMKEKMDELRKEDNSYFSFNKKDVLYEKYNQIVSKLKRKSSL